MPSKPITIVSAQASGGASDTVVRAVQERLQAALGQPIVMENRPGASGNVGAAQVARAIPDGYTLLVGTDAIMTSNVHLFKSMPFDPVKDFAPITNAGANIIVLAVHADVPAKSVAELVVYARANPGKVQFGSSGVASPHHLAGELLKLKTGIDIVHVPYRGGALSANDLAGGHIAMAFLSYSAAVALIPTGKVRVLAVVEKTRYVALPDVPTVGETIPGFEMSSWLGFFAPSGTPRPIVTRLHDEIVKILKVDQVKERLAAVGLAVVAGTPADLAETIRNGIAVRGELESRQDRAAELALPPALDAELGDLADGVAVRLESQARRFGHGEISVLRLRQAGENLPAHLHRQVMVLDQRAVRYASLEMHIVEAPGAAVGNRHIERIGEPRDLHALRKSTADDHVRLGVVDRLRHQQVTEAERQGLVLPAC